MIDRTFFHLLMDEYEYQQQANGPLADAPAEGPIRVRSRCTVQISRILDQNKKQKLHSHKNNITHNQFLNLFLLSLFSV